MFQHLANALGMKFAWIPPGTFLMGSPTNEVGRSHDEIPHRVTLAKGFYLGVYLVTQEQWQSVMGHDPSRFKDERNLPVDGVSWHDCLDFITSLRQGDRYPYRLPTEAEWEYSCRAGTMTPFHFGETISTEQANYNGNYAYGDGSKGVYRGKTTPVGSFPANAWGLHDMHGNLMEWCADWHGDYANGDLADPQGPTSGKLRVLRGGSWYLNPGNCRSARRGKNEPGLRYLNCGFRLCFSAE